VKAYNTVKIGDPLENGILCGPLHSTLSLDVYNHALEKIGKEENAKILCGGKRCERKGYFV
jgi:aldehyde dehydrogenase family 7 protein A1